MLQTKQEKTFKYFRCNDHVDSCLNKQKPKVISQLYEIIMYGHKHTLDWYITGGGDNTARCGRRNIGNAKAHDRLVRVRFSQKGVTIIWRQQAVNTEWNQQKKITAQLPLAAQDLKSLKKCIYGLAKLHKLQPTREGYWPTYYINTDLASDFEAEVQKSLFDSPKQRKARLRSAIKKPSRRNITIAIFNRNPDVVAEVLLRAAGKCEHCGKNAPFISRAKRTPYLEVHHKKMLAENGDDTVKNAIALCPNCHRQKHFG